MHLYDAANFNWLLTVSGMIQFVATVFPPLWRAFCLDHLAFTPGRSPVILIHPFLNVKIVNLSSRKTGRDYVLIILFFVLFTQINAAAKSMTNKLIIPQVISWQFNLFQAYIPKIQVPLSLLCFGFHHHIS